MDIPTECWNQAPALHTVHWRADFERAINENWDRITISDDESQMRMVRFVKEVFEQFMQSISWDEAVHFYSWEAVTVHYYYMLLKRRS